MSQVRFIYKDQEYLRVIPSKNLFRSTMVHEVVNRRDIFAVRVSDSVLTIIPGNAQVQFLTLDEPTIVEKAEVSQSDVDRAIETIKSAAAKRNKTLYKQEQAQRSFAFRDYSGSESGDY